MGAAGAREGHGRSHTGPKGEDSHPEENKRERPKLGQSQLNDKRILSNREEAHFQDDKRLQESQVEAELGRGQVKQQMVQTDRQWLILDIHGDKGSLSSDVSQCWTRGRPSGKTHRPRTASIRLDGQQNWSVDI